jgi:hypothetical protein
MWRHRTVGAEFITDAPHIATVRQQLPATPMEVWACLEDAEAWTVWLGLNAVTWTSELGPGATRTVRNGPVSVDEEFFLWEPGEVMAFRFARSILPVKALTEEYRLTDNGDGTTELAWTFSVEGAFGLAGALVLRQLTALGRRTAPQLAAYLV